MEEEQQPTNEATSPEEQVVESGQPEAETQAEVSSNEGAVEAVENPADSTAEAEPSWDAKTSYDALQKNYDQVNQSYAELRREFTRRTQNEADLQKKLDNLTDTINKATEKPIDPKQFFNDLQTQGPKAFDPILQKHEATIRKEYDARLQEQDGAISNLQFENAKLIMAADGTNYPDFDKLQPAMAKVVEDNKVVLPWEEGAMAVMRAVYNHAKNLNADKAIKEAKEIGRREEEARAAKEANARVAGGGKAGPVADPDKMSVDELRARFVAEIGEAENR